VDNKKDQPQKLQMNDILIPDAVLTSFIIELNDEVKKFIEETQKKQEQVLKLKEVSEEQLRKVVML